MTTVAPRADVGTGSREEIAEATVTGFFNAYRAHDVEGMVDLCTEDAGFRYVPFEVWGRQRVLHGEGTVRTVGKLIWTALINAFPDLTNAVTSLRADADGNVAAEAVIGGTQARAFGIIACAGGRYELPFLFLFRVTGDGLIDDIVAYWDNVAWKKQLGCLEVDLAVARMPRETWYDIARDLDWELSYVDYESVFPEWMSGPGKVPREAWAKWDEPYKVTYPEYVATQREKETGAYSVKAVLRKSRIFDQLDEGWKSVAKQHFGAVALVEDLAAYAELRMARFGLSPAWRNMAVFGALDETRHTQISLYFPHELVGKDPQYDWAHKAYHTNQWAVVAARAAFDGMMMNPNVVDVAVQLPFTFETGFTNVQFVALAADALESGDINFANMLSSIQTDEARHSQQGGPTLEILVEHDPRRAQWIIDKTFWVSARLFSVLTGPAMDYYTPLPMRKQSYSEFMREWIAEQFIDQLRSYGLKKPWYWDEFMAGLDTWHHSLHLGVWYWRPTVWWNPQGGVSPEERDWLHEKYPEWEERFGPIWDVIIGNINDDRSELTLPQTLPWLCNLCHLPIGTAGSPRNEKYPVRSYPLRYGSRTYHFCSRPCRQIWWEDRDTLHDPTVVERLLGGEIQPPTAEGVLSWMGLTPEVRGGDAYGYRWAHAYPPRRQAGADVRPEQVTEPAGAGRPVPVNALFSGDFVSQLVVLRDTDSVDQAARKVAAQVVGRRVPPRAAGFVVRLDGQVLPGNLTVAGSGISAMDVVNVGWAE